MSAPEGKRGPFPVRDFYMRLHRGEITQFNGLTIQAPLVVDPFRRYVSFTGIPPEDEMGDAARIISFPIRAEAFLDEAGEVVADRARIALKTSGGYVEIRINGRQRQNLTSVDPAATVPEELDLAYPFSYAFSYNVGSFPGVGINYDRENKAHINLTDTISPTSIDDYHGALRFRGQTIAAVTTWSEDEGLKQNGIIFDDAGVAISPEGTDIDLSKYYDTEVRKAGKNIMIEVAKKVSGDRILVMAPTKMDVSKLYYALSKDGTEWRKLSQEMPFKIKTYK